VLLAQLAKDLGELNLQFAEANGELDTLQTEAALMTKRLNAASQLIEGLTGTHTAPSVFGPCYKKRTESTK
jgi:hypothetical protein